MKKRCCFCGDYTSCIVLNKGNNNGHHICSECYECNADDDVIIVSKCCEPIVPYSQDWSHIFDELLTAFGGIKW